MKRLFETMDDSGMFLDYVKVALPTQDIQSQVLKAIGESTGIKFELFIESTKLFCNFEHLSGEFKINDCEL